jgi:DUF4097 and DUF4098 domain-containing protein YvlB
MKALIAPLCLFMLFASCVSISMGGDLLEVRTLERTLPHGGTLRFHNSNGSLELTEWNEDHIEIEMSIFGDSAVGVPENLQINLNESDGELFCSVAYPGGLSSNSVNFRVRVPSGMGYHLALETVNGTADVVAGLTGSVEAVNGSVRMEVDAVDSVKIVNGSIDLTLARQQNDLTASTTNGNVRILSSALYAIEAGTVNGGISVSGRGYGRHASIAMDGGWLLEARTVNGNIDIDLLP